MRPGGSRDGEVREFIQRNAWLYTSLDDLIEGRDKLRSKILSRKNPLALDLDDDAEPASLTDALKQRRTRARWKSDSPTVLSRATISPGHCAAVGFSGVFQERAGEQLVQAVQAFVSSHPPKDFIATCA